jgi:S1-C subfamily serine protease
MVYAAVVAALLIGTGARRQRIDAPAPPPPPPGLAEAPIPTTSPFAADRVSRLGGAETPTGAAFSVGDRGLWLTAGSAVGACARIVLVVAEGRAVAAKVMIRRDGLALLATAGGTAALPLAPIGPERGEQLFLPGFPQGAPGEVAARMLGSWRLPSPGRGVRPDAAAALVEDGRTEGLTGPLSGLAGAPVLNAAGQVVGVALAQAPLRGRIYAATPQAISVLLAAARVVPARTGAAPISADNQGRAADALRRDLRVVQVVCATG